MTNQGRAKGDLGDELDTLEHSSEKVIIPVPDGADERESLEASRITLTVEQKMEVKKLVRLVAADKEVDLAQIISSVTGIDVKTLQGKSLYLVDMLV